MTLTITTETDENSLPTDTVALLADGTAAQLDMYSGHVTPETHRGKRFWRLTNAAWVHSPLPSRFLPATILHTPGEQPLPLPDREQIARAMEQVLIETVGECTCDEAYTTRNLDDPDCLWHNINPHGEFPGDAADAVLALLKGEPQ